MECLSCRYNDQFDWLPPRERIAADPHWRVAHAIDTTLPGWLVLVPRRHVTSIANLTDAEAVGLGIWQVRLSRALTDAVGCQKTYVAQFAENANFDHVHFHVIPRMTEMSDEFIGPQVFSHLDGAHGEPVSAADMDEIAMKLRAYLQDDELPS
jgi:diadenosine tetraphosphate (Ap4A) HIT family hydrolase